jgi:hypothetical protein
MPEGADLSKWSVTRREVDLARPSWPWDCKRYLPTDGEWERVLTRNGRPYLIDFAFCDTVSV